MKTGGEKARSRAVRFWPQDLCTISFVTVKCIAGDYIHGLAHLGGYVISHSRVPFLLKNTLKSHGRTVSWNLVVYVCRRVSIQHVTSIEPSRLSKVKALINIFEYMSLAHSQSIEWWNDATKFKDKLLFTLIW